MRSVEDISGLVVSSPHPATHIAVHGDSTFYLATSGKLLGDLSDKNGATCNNVDPFSYENY